NHTASQSLNLANNSIINGGAITATSFTGDGSGLTGISGDNLGNHTASQSLNLANNSIINGGAITATSFTGDGSGLTGVPGDNLGNHITTTNIRLQSNWLSGDGGNEGISVDADGDVGIGQNSPNASALLDITSTNKGVLLPRMTSTQRAAISNPATGLLVYQMNSPQGVYEYNGTRWSLLGGALANGNLTTEAFPNGAAFLDVNQSQFNSSGGAILFQGGGWQSFTPVKSGYFKSVEVYYDTLVSPPAGPTISVYAGQGTSGSQLVSQTFIGSSSTGFVRYTFSNPVYLTAGQQYTFQVMDASAGWYFQTPGPYSGGISSQGSNIDFTFRTYVVPDPYSLVNANS
ncbi:MAG: hypothetical protein AAFO91_19005, partial [Bacteroidota bacterium]